MLLGVSLGLTALAKWEFPPALIGQFFLVLYMSIIIIRKAIDKKALREIIFDNFILTMITGFLVSFIWYFLSAKNIIWRLFFREDENIFINNMTTWNTRLFSVPTLSYYPLTVINVHIRFFYFLLLIILGTIFMHKAIKNKNWLLINNRLFYLFFLISWIIIPYICFTFIKIQAPSHIMLILPALAIIISAGIFSFIKRKTKIILICSVILFGLSCHLHSFLFIKEIEPCYNFKIYLRNDGKLALTTHGGAYMRDNWEIRRFYPPDNRDWKIREMLSFIKNDGLNKTNKALVLVLSTRDFIDSFEFQYYNLLDNYKLYIEPRGNDRSESSIDPSKFDYVIIIDDEGKELNQLTLKELVKKTPNLQPKAHKSHEFLINFSQKYKFIKEYLLPDNLVARIYKFTIS